MNDFKVGDTVFYFSDDSCEQICHYDLEVHCDSIERIDFDRPQTTQPILVSTSSLFRSKNEAIDAMIARLNELRVGL